MAPIGSTSRRKKGPRRRACSGRAWTSPMVTGGPVRRIRLRQTSECRTFLPDMPCGYTSLYVRRDFFVEDPAAFEHLVLLIRADDGFVAYLNEEEVARARVGEEAVVPYDQPATGSSKADVLGAVSSSRRSGSP